MTTALSLDFDGSVLPLPGVRALPLSEHQETIRFGCRMKELRALAAELAPVLEPRPPVVFLGSGDYHHVSLPLVERLQTTMQTNVQVVVFDNHPDNMRYPFGIHCGSWIWHVSRLPFVERVHVAGITSGDVEGLHVLENHLGALRSGKVRYYTVGRNLRGLQRLGVRASRSFSSIAEALEALKGSLTAAPVYLSIDKDVLAPDVVQTNWDQGVMRLEELLDAIAMLQGRVIGSDITGDVSSYRYRSRFKRFLSGLDAQPDVGAASLREWQEGHQRVNERLLSAITSTMR